MTATIKQKNSSRVTSVAKKKKQSSEDRHKGESLLLRVDGELKEAIRQYARSLRLRSMTQVAVLMLEEIAHQKGIWEKPSDALDLPPKKKPEEGP